MILFLELIKLNYDNESRGIILQYKQDHNEIQNILFIPLDFESDFSSKPNRSNGKR